MPETNLNLELYFLIGVVAVVVFVPTLIRLLSFSNDFSRELKYLKNEIQRTTGSEQEYWMRQKRRLWLSLIPFVKYR